MCLPYGFVGLWPVAILNVLFGWKFVIWWYRNTYNKWPSWFTAIQQTPTQTRTFRMVTGHKPTNQQNHKANMCIAIVPGHPNKTVG
jgi:hypothetical protein